ncbi:MAG: alpha/beta hydrolase [Ahrensia sp.]|nr:alpha/beta hydrolase [Ahrensia sp.]
MTVEPQLAALGDLDVFYFDIPGEIAEAPPIVLIHGFASTAQVNWLGTGWVKMLSAVTSRVIAFDNRGHGGSTKFYRAEEYGPDIFAADTVALMDHLGIQQADIMGYSMGARITAYLSYWAPERVRRAVFGGMGINIFGNKGGYEPVAEALEADDPSTISDQRGFGFRAFADRVGADRLALAACIRKSQVQITAQIVSSITTPVLIAVGTDDEIAGSPHELAELMPNAAGFDIDGADHMKATGAPTYKARVIEFLRQE